MSRDDFRWTPTHDARPRHWLHDAVVKVTAPSSAREAQQAQWEAFVRCRRLTKRMRRPDAGLGGLRCWTSPLDRPINVQLTQSCRCRVCREGARQIAASPNPDLTRGPRRLTRAQRKATATLPARHARS